MADAARVLSGRVVVRFTLPSTGDKWNWPVEGEDSVDALTEILDQADISWEVRRASD